MALQIYNSMTRKKETFVPVDPAGRKVLIYNCGPTVYDHFHIGNARNFVVMDIIRAWLSRSYEVTFVQNLTDIDDKIIKRMHEEGMTFEEVTEKYKRAYFDDAAKLRIRPADVHPCATEYIPKMIDLMRRLEEKGLAYAAGGSLYFRVRGFEGYGKLSGRSPDDMKEGARVEVSEEKEDPLDFVLWKGAKPGEPKWDSPWGEGRPGWHLECSTMAMSLLGETIDIHSGGTDLMFPHHENEIAQSEGATGREFARCWIHNGFLNIDSEKMSKSLGNFLKIDQVLANHPVPAVRFFLLSAVYRHPLDYNEGALEEATSSVRRINEGLITGRKIIEIAGASMPGLSEKALRTDPVTEPFAGRFALAMDDDFNTPKALAVLHDIVSAIHDARQARPLDFARLGALVEIGERLRDFFGLQPGERAVADESVKAINHLLNDVEDMAAKSCAAGWPEFAGSYDDKGALVELLIAYRTNARVQKKFEIADVIRKRLAGIGIALEDHPQGTIWKETGWKESGAAGV